MDHYGNQLIYCRKLGHELSLDYCRRENNDLPCPAIIACWFGRMDINGFLEESFTKEEIANAFSSSKPKLASIVELIEQAKKRGGGAA